ncbi:hypothetical protein QQ045_007473 [Rhodiola kirilowii]
MERTADGGVRRPWWMGDVGAGIVVARRGRGGCRRDSVRILSREVGRAWECSTSLDAGDSIVVAKSFSHVLNLANLAEEVQIVYRRRIKLKKRDFAVEASATTESDIEETIRKLVRMG